MMRSPAPARFRLLRKFLLLGGLVIGLVGLVHGLTISRFLTGQLFAHEARITQDLVQHVLDFDGAVGFFAAPHDTDLAARFNGSLGRLGKPVGVLRTNVFAADGTILRSTNPDLAGRRFSDNAELARALGGEMVVDAGRVVGDSASAKPEQRGLAAVGQYFVEAYLPVRDRQGRVVGVLEIYKQPLGLTQAIEAGRRQAFWSAGIGALALFLSLTGLVLQADRLLGRQAQRLREADALSAVGQLAAAVAHNIRNPLASIRSSAELALDAPLTQARGCANDILKDADRISARLGELLRLAVPPLPTPNRVDVTQLIHQSVEAHQHLFARRRQRLVLDVPDRPVFAHADALELHHVLQGLLSNAVEALPPRGRCRVKLSAGRGRRLRIEVQDNGHGMPPDVLARVGQPFFTRKPQGMGLGLALARRTVERLGGALTLKSQPAVGTTVRIELPAA